MPPCPSSLERPRHWGAALLAGLFSGLLIACHPAVPAAPLQAGQHSHLQAAALIHHELPRYGLNLGGSGTWGAEQLRANIVANPGFEAILDRALLIVGRIDGRLITDDTDWVARPTGFWDGGEYQVMSGAAAGRQGEILASERIAGSGPQRLRLDRELPLLQPGDVLALSRPDDPAPAPRWWFSPGQVAASRDVAADSPGRQSLRLLARPDRNAEIRHYFDNIGERAGKLLPVNGDWRLSLRLRAVAPGARLLLRFERHGQPAFLVHELSPEASWQSLDLHFSTVDNGPPGVLTLSITAQGGEIRIDDVYLGEAEPSPGGFRQVVLATLRSLAPGYLRDWQGQLGDRLDNRLAGEFAHRPVRYRPGNGDEAQFHYGLPDFLELCAAVHAQPWIVAPTTLSEPEWQDFGRWLRQAADRHGFREIRVEFGNENWNAIFRPAGIPAPAALGAVADRAFRQLRAGFGDDPRLQPVLGAQFVNPDSPRAVAAASREAAAIAVAPYFLYQLDAGRSDAELLTAAFADDGQLLRREAGQARQQGKTLTVYEVNFHTTAGNADATLRNRMVTSRAGGAALARRLLQGTLAGVREQAVYTLAAFDSRADDGKTLVRLWGISRDLATADRLRPTGLALALLNRVAHGPVHALACRGPACPALTAAAFGNGQAYALVNAGTAQPVSLSLACSPGSEWTLAELSGEPFANNENEPQVSIREQTLICAEQQLQFTVPAYTLQVLYPGKMPPAHGRP